MLFRHLISTSFLLFLTYLSYRPCSLTIDHSFPTRLAHSRRQSGGCSRYIMVGARGTGEMQGYSVAYTAMAKRVLQAVPGGVIHDIKYNAMPEYMTTPKAGARTGNQYIKAQHAKCPKTVFVLMGFSKGAIVITQILASKDLPPNIVVAVALFGNPYFKAGLSQNKCSAKTGKGILTMMHVSIPKQYVPLTYDCCLAGDMICQTVGQMMTHMSYGSRAAAGAQAFIVAKLKAALAGGGGAPTPGPTPGGEMLPGPGNPLSLGGKAGGMSGSNMASLLEKKASKLPGKTGGPIGGMTSSLSDGHAQAVIHRSRGLGR